MNRLLCIVGILSPPFLIIIAYTVLYAARSAGLSDSAMIFVTAPFEPFVGLGFIYAGESLRKTGEIKLETLILVSIFYWFLAILLRSTLVGNDLGPMALGSTMAFFYAGWLVWESAWAALQSPAQIQNSNSTL